MAAKTLTKAINEIPLIAFYTVFDDNELTFANLKNN